MRKKVKADGEVRKLRPALTPEARENQMVALAMDLAERQLMEGTASSQVITHYLKIGSTEQRRRIEKLEAENKLLRAKAEALDSSKRMEELYEEAINVFKIYRGESKTDDEDDY